MCHYLCICWINAAALMSTSYSLATFAFKPIITGGPRLLLAWQTLIGGAISVPLAVCSCVVRSSCGRSGLPLLDPPDPRNYIIPEIILYKKQIIISIGLNPLWIHIRASKLKVCATMRVSATRWFSPTYKWTSRVFPVSEARSRPACKDTWRII